jgi:hypothetical protein
MSENSSIQTDAGPDIVDWQTINAEAIARGDHEMYDEDGAQILNVPLSSWNAYVDEIIRLRTALETIYDDPDNGTAGIIAARALRKGAWA